MCYMCMSSLIIKVVGAASDCCGAAEAVAADRHRGVEGLLPWPDPEAKCKASLYPKGEHLLQLISA